jgi:hypothetical protein
MSARIYIPITKVDAAQRIVYGTFTEEAVDRSNEIMDYQTSKPNFEHWSNEVYKSSGGKSYGNVRAMHKPIGAGVITQPIEFDDNARVMKAMTRIIDNDEWEKVEAGVYTGFSVGGIYSKRWQDPSDPTKVRYTATPTEISLVDLPCAKGATFEYVKDNTSAAPPEQRLFKSVVADGIAIDYSVLPELTPPVTPPSLLDKAASTSTPADTGAGSQTPPKTDAELVDELKKRIAALEAAATTGAISTPKPVTEPLVVYKATDGTYFEKRELCEAHNATLEMNAAVAGITSGADEALQKLNSLLNKDLNASSGTEPGVQQTSSTAVPSSPTTQVPEKPKAPVYGKAHLAGLSKDASKEQKQDALNKGMYDISRIASLLCELKWCYECMATEAAVENDNSANPGKAAAIISAMVDLLSSVVAEETSELLATVQGDGGEAQGPSDTIIIMAAAMPETLLKGTLNCGVPVDEKLTKAYKDALQNLEKSQQLNKTFGLTFTEADLRPDNSDLPQAVRLVLVKNAGLENKVTQYGDQLAKLAKRVEELAAEPVPFKGVQYQAVSKAQDTAQATGGQTQRASDNPQENLEKALAAIPPEHRAMAMMKYALANPTLNVP